MDKFEKQKKKKKERNKNEIFIIFNSFLIFFQMTISQTKLNFKYTALKINIFVVQLDPDVKDRPFISQQVHFSCFADNLSTIFFLLF